MQSCHCILPCLHAIVFTKLFVRKKWKCWCLQCIKVAGDHVEWEHGGNRTVQIAEGPCQVAFDWGDEGSLRVELANGKATSSNGHVEASHEQEPSAEVRMRHGVL